MNGYPLVTLIMAISFSLIISQSYLFRVYANQEEKLNELGIGACELTDEETERKNSASQSPQRQATELDSSNSSIPGVGQSRLAETIQQCEEYEKSLRDDLDKTRDYVQNATSEFKSETLDKFKQEYAQSFCMPNCG